MPIQIVGYLGAFSAFAILRLRREIRRLHSEIEVKNLVIENQSQWIAYLADMIDRNDIEISEFDQLVLFDLLQFKS